MSAATVHEFSGSGVDLERQLLGTLIEAAIADEARGRALMGQAVGALRPEDFGDKRHAALFRAMGELDADDMLPGPLALIERLQGRVPEPDARYMLSLRIGTYPAESIGRAVERLRAISAARQLRAVAASLFNATQRPEAATKDSVAEIARRLSQWLAAAERMDGDSARAGGVRALRLADFLGLEIPGRRPLLVGESGQPLLREKDLAMIYAPRGAGKTWFSLGLGVAVAGAGRFLRWHTPQAGRVVLVDGEMPAGLLQERLRLLVRCSGIASADLHVISADLQERPLGSLVTPETQARIAAHLDGAALLIIDNVSSLMGNLDENDAGEWAGVQEWLLTLRRRGVAVLLVHHAGKAGQQRGTSRREDVLDLVLRLSLPADYSADQGLRFECHVTKARGVDGRDLEPFEASLVGGEWRVSDVAGRDFENAVAMLAEGARPGEVSEALGISRATVYRYQKRGRDEGKLPPRGVRQR
jgi:hypothetical protein